MMEWNEVKCPHCKKPMRFDATICPHCRTEATPDELLSRKTELKHGAIGCGLVALIALLSLAYCSSGEGDSQQTLHNKPLAAIYTDDYQSCIGVSGQNVALGLNNRAEKPCKIVAAQQDGACQNALIALTAANENDTVERSHIDKARNACEPDRMVGPQYTRPALLRWPVDEELPDGDITGESETNKRARQAYLRANQRAIAACYGTGAHSECVKVIMARQNANADASEAIALSGCSNMADSIQARQARLNAKGTIALLPGDVGGDPDDFANSLKSIQELATNCDHELKQAGLPRLVRSK